MRDEVHSFRTPTFDLVGATTPDWNKPSEAKEDFSKMWTSPAISSPTFARSTVHLGHHVRYEMQGTRTDPAGAPMSVVGAIMWRWWHRESSSQYDVVLAIQELAHAFLAARAGCKHASDQVCPWLEGGLNQAAEKSTPASCRLTWPRAEEAMLHKSTAMR